jgi:hypothetical protein
VATAADYGVLGNAVESVGQQLTDCGTSCDPTSVAVNLVETIRPILGVIAVTVFMIAGIRMVTSQEDDGIDKLKKLMTAGITGFIMSFLILPFIEAFYGTSGEVVRTQPEVGINVLEREIVGIINWALTLAAVVAIVMIILTATKAVVNFNSDEGVSRIRKTVYSVLAGLVILALKYTLSYMFIGSPSTPIPILANFVIFISYLLGFLALLAVLVVIYAGILCLISFGNEENLTKAKGILYRAVLGAVVLLTSLAIVNFIVWPTFA